MSRAHLFAAALAAYLLALLVGAPAERLRGPMESLLPDVRLGTLTGHPLAGRADGARLGTLAVDEVAWRWRPLPLFRGRLGLAVELTTGPTRTRLDLAVAPSGEIAVERLDGVLDLAWLGSALADPGFTASGRLAAEAVSLTLAADGWPRAAAGRLRLADGRLDTPLAFPLGAAEGVLGSRDGWLELDFSLPPGGPLAGKGLARLAADGRYALTARLAPGAPNGGGTHALLRMLGPGGADGTVRVALQGTIR